MTQSAIHITFTPMRHDGKLKIERCSEILLINGEAVDLSEVPEVGCVSCESIGCSWLVGDITRSAEGLHLTMILPHGANAVAEQMWPAPISIFRDGIVILPGMTEA